MKIKSDYVMREVAGTCVVVPTGKASIDFSGMISLNGTGAFLWKQLAEDKTEQELLSAMLEEYETDEATVKADISEFLQKLKEADLLE
ncbi:PqqD family protein [Desulfoscipio sp. XC116]|uniref:PqqD family protein n=1 Tax=Desulfoscipio sp. XC116 TaxID=3144975 RepID=UPI00325A996D